MVFDSNVVLDGRYVRLDDLNNQTVSQLIAGTNITLSPTSGIGVVTINSTASGGAGGFYFPGASLTLSDGNFFNVNDANLALTFYTQTDANGIFISELDANDLYVKLNPTAGQVIAEPFDLNHLVGHTFLGHTFIFGDDPDDELLVIRQAPGATDHILTIERSNESHLFTILPNGQQDVNIVADDDSQIGIHVHFDTNGFSQGVPIEIDHVLDTLGAEEEAHSILIALDQSALTQGEVTALEVVPTQGGARIIGLSTTALVSPIHQLSGVFEDMDSATVAGVDRLAEFISTGSDISMFLLDDDNVVIGNSVQFGEIEFLLATEASGSGIKPTFEHSTGVSTFTAFIPTDTTKGMRENGVIVFDLDLIADDWVTGAGGEFLIRITRTANVLMTVPVESLVQIVVTEEFSWDQFGDLNVHDVNVQRHLTVDQNLNWGSLTYAPPSVRGVSGTLLTEDGSGNLTWTDPLADFVMSSVFNAAFDSDFNINNVTRLLQDSSCDNNSSCTLTGSINSSDANTLFVLKNPTTGQAITGIQDFNLGTNLFTTIGTSGDVMFDLSSSATAIGTTLRVRTAGGSDQTLVDIETFETIDARRSLLRLRKSATDTLGGFAATASGESLGEIHFAGVETTSAAFALGARIVALQDGAIGAQVPTTLLLTTFSSTGENANQLVLTSGGLSGFGVAAASITGKIHGVVNVAWNTADYAFVFDNQETQNSFGNTVKIIGGGGAGGVGNAASDILSVEDNAGTIKFTVQGNNLSAFGTGSPATTLEVENIIVDDSTLLQLDHAGVFNTIGAENRLDFAQANTVVGRIASYLVASGTRRGLKFYIASGELQADAIVTFTDENRVGINREDPRGTLDVVGNSGTVAQQGLFLSNVLTDNVAKQGVVMVPGFDSDEEPTALFAIANISGASLLFIGGGSGFLNAATSISFLTAANETTLGGVVALTIDSSQNIIATNDFNTDTLRARGDVTFENISSGDDGVYVCITTEGLLFEAEGGGASDTCISATPKLFDSEGSFLGKIAGNLRELDGVSKTKLHGYNGQSEFTFTIKNEDPEIEFFDHIYLEQRFTDGRKTTVKRIEAQSIDKELVEKDDDVFLTLQQGDEASFSFTGIEEATDYVLVVSGYYEKLQGVS